VCAGKDPLTGRELWFQKTRRTEVEAQIELGKLLGLAESRCRRGAAAAGLVPDPVRVGTDGADADVQPGGALGAGGALGDKGDQFPLPGAEPGQAPQRLGLPQAGVPGGRQGVFGSGPAYRRASSPLTASSLTAAELRLLPTLSTHLTAHEIAAGMYVSRHTIKA